MADEPAKIILGDNVISALEQPRRFFPRRKDRQSPQPTHCENCGAQLHGRWCAQCGQPAIDYRRSFRHVIADVLESFLNWDSKFFATIGLLIVKPWRLTNEFLAGRRVRYLHPLRLYLLASVLFFLAVNQFAKSAHIQPGPNLKSENLPPEAQAKLEEAQIRIDDAMAKVPTVSGEPIRITDQPAKDPFGQWLEARAKEKLGEHGTKTQLFLLGFINNLPYMMLAAIPLFAVVLKLLYLRRHIYYIDHLVYALHIHTFAYLAIMLIVFATMGLNRTVPNLTGVACTGLWIAFATQVFLSIRRVYRQGWFISVFKFFLGGFAYLIVLSIALTATFLITLWLS